MADATPIQPDAAAPAVAPTAPAAAPQEIPVVTPRGQLATVPSANLQKALSMGFKLADDQQVHEISMRMQYGDGLGNTLRAGLEGAGRGLTFGLSDIALQKLGIESKEALGELKERHGVAAGVGEAAGVAGGLLAGGVGEALGAGVRGVSALGTLAEQGAGRLVGEGTGSLASRVLAKGITKAAGGAVEGTAYAAGHEVSEAALGDPSEVGQKLVAHLGAGALLGGITAGALGGFGEALGGGVDAARGAYAKAKAALGDTVTEAAVKGAKIASGADEGLVRTLMDPGDAGREARRIAFASDEGRDAHIRKLTGLLNADAELSQPVTEKAIGSLKAKRVAELMGDGNTGVSELHDVDRVQAAKGTINEARQQVKSMLSEKGVYGHEAQMKKALGVLDDYEKRIDAAAASGEDVGAKAFMALDDAKRHLSPFARPGVFLSSADQSSAMEMRNLYHKFRDVLEEKKLWGNAAVMQQDINKAWTGYLDNADLYRSAFESRAGKNEFNPRFATNPEAIESYLGNITRARNDLKENLLTSHIKSQRTLLETIARHHDLSPDMLESIASVQGNSATIEQTLADISGNVKLQNSAKELLGTAVGRTIRKFATAEQMLNNAGAPTALNAIGSAAGKVTARISQGVDAFVSGIDKSSKFAVPASVGAIHDKFLPHSDAESTKDPQQAFRDRFNEVASIVANPTGAANRLQEVMKGMYPAAPQVTGQMATTTLRAAQFLYDKAPKRNVVTGINPNATPWRISDADLAKWQRYVHAVNDPLSVIEELKNGHISTEGVEALKTVYPAVYNEMAKTLIPKLAERSEQMPMQQRMQLTFLFGVPVDSLAQPSFMAAVQQGHAESMAQEAAAHAAHGAPPGKSPIAAAAKTPMQSIASSS